MCNYLTASARVIKTTIIKPVYNNSKLDVRMSWRNLQISALTRFWESDGIIIGGILAVGQGFVYRDPPTKELIISHYLSPLWVLLQILLQAPGRAHSRVSSMAPVVTVTLSHWARQEPPLSLSLAITISVHLNCPNIASVSSTNDRLERDLLITGEPC